MSTLLYSLSKQDATALIHQTAQVPRLPPLGQNPSVRQRGSFPNGKAILKVQTEKLKLTSYKANATLCLQLTRPANSFNNVNKSSGENK